MNHNIAIDGPAGAGKSTIARAVAAERGAVYIDTGAMYRAMALYLLKKGISPEDKDSMKTACREADISIKSTGGEQRVFLNGEDVSGMIRTEDVSLMASVCSAVPEIREKLVSLQRKLAADTDVVMDGRDIGTVVLPDAAVKIYLTASPEERARRRFLQIREKEGSCPFSAEELEKTIRERDERDMNRKISPLRKAGDAVLIDSTHMTAEEVIARIQEIANA